MDGIILRQRHKLQLNLGLQVTKVWRQGEMARKEAVTFQDFYFGKNDLSQLYYKAMFIVGMKNKYQSKGVSLSKQISTTTF